MEAIPPYRIFFIGDSVATIDFGNVIDEQINKKAIAIFHHLCEYPLLGMIEALPAYSSVTVYFDVPLLRKKISPQKKVYEWITKELHKLMLNDFLHSPVEEKLLRIPVCYESEFADDLAWIAEEKKISAEQIVRVHSSKKYRVYMLGFLPGFAYMGEVPEEIAVSRKPQPQSVLAGSVGIAGKQTGIYPLNSPAGWRIIGRTPMQMFDKNKPGLCLLNAGDQVEFYPITQDEFNNYQVGSF
jgi:inhibitor of KinA